MASVQHGENLLLCRAAVSGVVRRLSWDVLGLDARDEIAAELVFQPFEELDVAAAGFPLRVNVGRCIFGRVDVIAVDRREEIEPRHALFIAACSEVTFKLRRDRLRDPDDGTAHVLVVEIEDARSENLLIIRPPAGHIRRYEVINLDAVVVLGIPFDETTGVALVAVEQHARVHAAQHDTIEPVAKRLQNLQHEWFLLSYGQMNSFMSAPTRSMPSVMSARLSLAKFSRMLVQRSGCTT